MPRKAKRTLEAKIAASAQYGKAAFFPTGLMMPVHNYRLPRENFVKWTHTIPKSLAATFKRYPREVATLQALIFGADDALMVLAAVSHICPECRGGMGGCLECQFTGCADGYGQLKDPHCETLRQRWFERVLGVFACGALEESLRRSNPKDFPKLPKGKEP